MLQRFLDPSTLASISGLDLVAKTVVDGFVAGLHRSPDFGFSQEFAEYRAYSQGDDLRHVDWNVFARTGKCSLKRYRGETNSQLLILLDTSASMAYGSHAVHKLDYACSTPSRRSSPARIPISPNPSFISRPFSTAAASSWSSRISMRTPPPSSRPSSPSATAAMRSSFSTSSILRRSSPSSASRSCW